MRQALTLHPDSICFAATHIEVEVARPRASTLVLSYVVTAAISEIRMPPVGTAAPSEELWRQICFKAFVHALASTACYEFNFAPSTQWAACRFSGYRSRMLFAANTNARPIEVQSNTNTHVLQITLNLDRLAGLQRDASWRLGLSAWIEKVNGRKSHRILSHPAGGPNLHHADCFVLEISSTVWQ